MKHVAPPTNTEESQMKRMFPSYTGLPENSNPAMCEIIICVDLICPMDVIRFPQHGISPSLICRFDIGDGE